ncbi:MAG: hypothetical protein LUC45_03100, partial [Paraprevotella sp.]|nr:hypothetical protein [Paraprevotella sp.]
TLYSNADVIHVNKVVLSDTATIMYCTARGKINSWFQFVPSTYLSDEEAVRYPVKGAVGLALGEKCYIPKAGHLEFRLLFEPMPQDTKLFDLIEGTDKDMFRIYGIHDAKAKVKIPEAKDEIDAEETSEKMFQKGDVVVRGKIEEYSRDWNEGILFFDLTSLGQDHIAPYPMSRPCTVLEPDGTFCTELSLDHPVWAEMKMGGENTAIPFYVRPGDTLDITVKGMREKNVTVDYVSSHPKGCYENLLKHQDVPVIYYEWNRLSDYGRNLNKEDFLNQMNESVAENMRLCDYVAWKYKFSPWETHLLKNRQRFELVDRYLFMAGRLFEEKVEYPKKMPVQKEDYVGYDYSAYKVLDILALDDPSFSFLPYSSGYPSSISVTYMMAFLDSYAFFDHSSDMGALDYEKVEIEKDSLQVKTLRELTGTEGTPWAVQAFLTDKVTRLQVEWSGEQRERFVDFLSSSYLTYPYFKDKIKELNRLSGNSASWVYEIPEGKGNREMKSILDKFKGRYVQVVWLSDPHEDSRFYGDLSVKNIMADYENFPDLQIIAIVNKGTYSDENAIAQMKKELSAPIVHIEDGESFLNMQALFHFYGSGEQMTFDRNGLVFKQSLNMKNETMFRDRFRSILKAEKEMK